MQISKEKNKMIRKAVNCLFNLVLMLILAVFAGLLFGVKPYIVMSGSMEPDIHTGSVCFVNTKSVYEDIREGDVIAFEGPSGIRVAHRVLSITEEGMETKGDANEISDGITTTKQNFQGRILFSIPYVGYVLAYLQRPLGLALAVVLFLAILIGDSMDIAFRRKQIIEEDHTILHE